MLELASVSTVCASLEINAPPTGWLQISNVTGWILLDGRELGSGERGKYFEVGSSASAGEAKATARVKDRNSVLFMRGFPIRFRIW
jgi:hypothetical protein